VHRRAYDIGTASNCDQLWRLMIVLITYYTARASRKLDIHDEACCDQRNWIVDVWPLPIESRKLHTYGMATWGNGQGGIYLPCACTALKNGWLQFSNAPRMLSKPMVECLTLWYLIIQRINPSTPAIPATAQGFLVSNTLLSTERHGVQVGWRIVKRLSLASPSWGQRQERAFRWRR